ncbi:phage baseplate upper protein [Mammaliicoccus lentus]|uniref:BppU family phage baseplate upper protein n=1 Tax=Mammaliicoccus lentus TaxID=42858 RepID=UPI001C4DE268|nr:BppU family phage baseplate upper protein [Mammaliicoccus lentus]MBW0770515.1 phage baseplate upper protein [Mammaliicoccus lentus]
MYNKEGRIQLETTAHIQNRLDTNIQFYNTDIGTADLVFNITRNGSPLLVSSENADVFIKLETTDKRKNYIVDTVLPVDPMNGKLKYTIPNDFLGLANKDNKTVKVVGQTWIAVRGKEDIVTHVEFSFSIKDSIINTIPAVDKLNEIRTFQEFRENIMTTINEINEALANGEDYVSQMEGTKASGMKALNDRTTQAVNELNTISESSVSSLNDLFTTISNDLTTKSEGALSDIDNAKQEVLSVIDSLVTQEELENKIQSALSDKNYQEYKLTDSQGRRTPLGTLGEEDNKYTSVLEIPPGFYECVIPSDAFDVNAPQEPNGKSYYAEIDVYEGSSGRKQFRLIMSHLNNEYRATVHTDGIESNAFKGWKKVQNEEEYNALFSDTGWIDWNTMNGATKRETDNPNAIQCQRRIRTVNGVKIAHLRVNVNNVVTQTVFGSIPADMVPKAQNFYIRTPVSMNPAVLLVDIDGTLGFYCSLNDTSKWLPGHYINGEFSWIIDDIGGGQ